MKDYVVIDRIVENCVYERVALINTDLFTAVELERLYNGEEVDTENYGLIKLNECEL